MALQRLGPFELVRVLGRGGMGTVYEAHETGSQHRVAVKALSPVYSFDELFRSRFEGEIDALMKLDHENIVRLLSYGQDEGNLFFAMELVEGSSLFQEQKQGQVFNWREIIEIGIQVCEGLRHAHDRGIIHRDLKPGNLMIDKQRMVKITDFGIAKSYGGSSLTSEGNVLGTMDFMAPEQARGKATTARSDIFSLGAVLYSLLAGRPPFLQTTVEQTFESLLSSSPPERLDRIASDIPKPLCQLIHRMLEKDPARRIATAQATGRQLMHVMEQVKNAPKRETQVVAADDDWNDDSNTRVVGDHATGERTSLETSVRKDSQFRKTSVSESAIGANVSRNPRSQDTDDFQTRQPDYFNEVTPQQRKKNSELKTNEETSSAWPLIIALLAVVVIFAFGIWFGLFRTPSEESLLAEIRGNDAKPQQVSTEIDLFLKAYPDSGEWQYVSNQRDLAEAYKFRNTLRIRYKLSTSDPSQIEQKFLDITNLQNSNPPMAREQLNSFLSVFGSTRDTLSTEDARCVEMAQRFLEPISRAADQRIIIDLDFGAEGLRRGRESNNRNDKISAFESLIDIYGDGESPWMDELIQEVRDELEKLK